MLTLHGQAALAKTSTCGNGAIDGGETCDKGPPANLSGASCADFDFAGGSLACSTACDYLDTGSCTATAGTRI